MKIIKKYKKIFRENLDADGKRKLKFIIDNSKFLDDFLIDPIYRNVIASKLSEDTGYFWHESASRLTCSSFPNASILIDDKSYELLLKNANDSIKKYTLGKSPFEIELKSKYASMRRQVYSLDQKNSFYMPSVSEGITGFLAFIYTALFKKVPLFKDMYSLTEKYFKLTADETSVFLYTWMSQGKVKIPELKNVEISIFKNKKIVLKNISVDALDEIRKYVGNFNE